jgi:hypothetical protein
MRSMSWVATSWRDFGQRTGADGLTRNFSAISPITFPHEGIMTLMTNRIINDTMEKIRRGNFIFVTWIGDHAPRHVHIFKRNKLLLKFDLDRRKAIEGRINRRIVRLIETLIEEGLL